MRTRSRKDRKEEIDDVYVAAKSFAKEKGIPLVSPSQANRGAAKSDIIEGDNAAGSYEKIMIGDIIISLARKRKDEGNPEPSQSSRDWKVQRLLGVTRSCYVIPDLASGILQG